MPRATARTDAPRFHALQVTYVEIGAGGLRVHLSGADDNLLVIEIGIAPALRGVALVTAALNRVLRGKRTPAPSNER